jgi:hypothetical protein
VLSTVSSSSASVAATRAFGEGAEPCTCGCGGPAAHSAPPPAGAGHATSASTGLSSFVVRVASATAAAHSSPSPAGAGRATLAAIGLSSFTAGGVSRAPSASLPPLSAPAEALQSAVAGFLGTVLRARPWASAEGAARARGLSAAPDTASSSEPCEARSARAIVSPMTRGATGEITVSLLAEGDGRDGRGTGGSVMVVIRVEIMAELSSCLVGAHSLQVTCARRG